MSTENVEGQKYVKMLLHLLYQIWLWECIMAQSMVYTVTCSAYIIIVYKRPDFCQKSDLYWLAVGLWLNDPCPPSKICGKGILNVFHRLAEAITTVTGSHANTLLTLHLPDVTCLLASCSRSILHTRESTNDSLSKSQDNCYPSSWGWPLPDDSLPGRHIPHLEYTRFPPEGLEALS